MLLILEADLWELEASPREFQDRVAKLHRETTPQPKQTQAVCLQYV